MCLLQPEQSWLSQKDGVFHRIKNRSNLCGNGRNGLPIQDEINSKIKGELQEFLAKFTQTIGWLSWLAMSSYDQRRNQMITGGLLEHVARFISSRSLASVRASALCEQFKFSFPPHTMLSFHHTFPPSRVFDFVVLRVLLFMLVSSQFNTCCRKGTVFLLAGTRPPCCVLHCSHAFFALESACFSCRLRCAHLSLPTFR